MPLASADTIAAMATPPGRGGVGIVRVSGPATRSVSVGIIGCVPTARLATLAKFTDSTGASIDHGLALFFPAPHSYTGEDVLELQGHGGPVVMDLLLRRTLELGARLARPGEYSERAFLNGKLDLAQAEAVADLIESGSEAAARAAVRSLEGEFSQRVHTLVESLIQLRLYIEAALDFPEDEIDVLAFDALRAQCQGVLEKITDLIQGTRQGSLLHDGMTVVLAGRPNAGKSSLLNALAQRDSAIVSAIPGTTRDVLSEHIELDGMPLHIIDTAGLRAASDEIEVEGVRRAQRAIAHADRVLLLLDDTDTTVLTDLLSQLPPTAAYTLVRNKIDLTGRTPGLAQKNSADPIASGAEIAISAKLGTGLDVLRHHLKACMGFQGAGAGTFSARRRHLEAIQRTRLAMEAALRQLENKHGELAAEELRLAQRTLSEITGEFTSDDLLGRIFSSFCLGK